MNLTTHCTVREVKRAGNGLRIATVELPDGTFGELPAEEGLKPGEPAQLAVTVGLQMGRLYPRAMRAERKG